MISIDPKTFDELKGGDCFVLETDLMRGTGELYYKRGNGFALRQPTHMAAWTDRVKVSPKEHVFKII